MDAKACQASSQSYRNPGCRWMGTQHSANSVTACKTSAPASHPQNVQTRVLAACPRLWQCPPAAAAVGVCCMCKDTLCPQPPCTSSAGARAQPEVTAHPGAQHTEPVGWADPLLLPKTSPLGHGTAGEPRGCCREVLCCNDAHFKASTTSMATACRCFHI